MNVKDRVTSLCRAKGISVPELERSVGLAKSAINKWSSSMPNTEKLILVADYFGVTLDSLVGREEPKRTRSVTYHLTPAVTPQRPLWHSAIAIRCSLLGSCGKPDR